MLSRPSAFSAVRTFTAARYWPDAYIDLWGEFYTSRPEIRARGVLFETFLIAPVEILRSLRLPMVAYLFAPIEIRCALGLPAVSDTQEKLEAVRESCGRADRLFKEVSARYSNGSLVEKLKHHRHRQGGSRYRSDFKPRDGSHGA